MIYAEYDGDSDETGMNYSTAYWRGYLITVYDIFVTMCFQNYSEM